MAEGAAQGRLQGFAQLADQPDSTLVQQMKAPATATPAAAELPISSQGRGNRRAARIKRDGDPLKLAQYKEPSFGIPPFMALDQLLDSAVPWLGWSGLGLALLTVVAFLANWGLRFRLVGVSSFTLLLAVSCWAFGVSYTPPVVVEGAIRAPVVFDNGTDLVVAQAPADLEAATVSATLEQLAGNLRSAGRGSGTVTVRLRAFETPNEGISRPVILGETVRDFRPGEL